MSVGLADSSEASKRAPVKTEPAHPPSMTAEAPNDSPRSTIRRDTAVLGPLAWRMITVTFETNGRHSAPPLLS